MVSNTDDEGQIVVSKEITMVSPPENTYGSKKYNQVNICDTCGDIGLGNSLVICSKCKVGAEHTYCMMVKIDDPPEEWFCYDCTKDKDGMQVGEQISSMKRKSESFIGHFKVSEITLSEEQHDLLNTPNLCKSVGVDLNMDPNLDLNAYPNIDMNVEPSSQKKKTELFIDFLKMSEKASSQTDLFNTQSHCKITGLDLNINPSLNLNKDPNINMNVGFNIDLNVEPNIDMDMGFTLNRS